ncbi:MAG: glycosyltransferase family 1 protein [Alistipes onderdonkii]
MKGLFVVFHGFSAHSGISKKIFAQCDALRRNGADIELCHIEIAPDGTQRRMVGGQAIRTFGKGLRAKLEKRVSLSDITRYIRHEGVEFLYIRHDHNASPVLIGWLRKVKKLGVRIALEIPTYPYDAEFAQSPAVRKLKLHIDRMFRSRMARYVDRIVTFSDDTEIFGRPTIRISNGIDFGSIPLKTRGHGDHHNIRLLAVANIHFWHGLDRVIEGLRSITPPAPVHRPPAYRRRRRGNAHRRIPPQDRRILPDGVCRSHRPRSGAALDAEFEWCDMGIASLGRHRNGITGIKTLKNREYAARGIPFVYSERDSDFDGMGYVMKAPADDTPLDIAALVRFYDGLHLTPAQIRGTVEGRLSWDNQMKQVLTELFEA